MSEALSDREALARQYADDQNLRARQRLWEISRSEPQLDFNAWSVDLMALRKEDLVLDVGCGSGRPLALLRERCTAVGVDLSLGMVEAAGHPLVAVADAERLPFPDGNFDGAAALMMLYHVPNQEAAAAELRRVVKRGGVVVATTAARRTSRNYECSSNRRSAMVGRRTSHRPRASTSKAARRCLEPCSIRSRSCTHPSGESR